MSFPHLLCAASYVLSNSEVELQLLWNIVRSVRAHLRESVRLLVGDQCGNSWHDSLRSCQRCIWYAKAMMIGVLVGISIENWNETREQHDFLATISCLMTRCPYVASQDLHRSYLSPSRFGEVGFVLCRSLDFGLGGSNWSFCGFSHLYCVFCCVLEFCFYENIFLNTNQQLALISTHLLQYMIRELLKFWLLYTIYETHFCW